MKLAELGWLQYERKIYFDPATVKQADENVGRIGVENKTNFVVHTEQGEIAGIIQGKFRHNAKSPSEYPKVGDWVVYEKLPNEEKAIIQKVLPRYSVIARKAAGDSIEAQIIAANVDALFIVYGLDKDFNAPLIERYLSMAYEGGVEPIVILNKIDATKYSNQVVKAAQNLNPGLTVIPISAKTSIGMHKIEELIEPGRTIAFVGPSGAGKSTMINAILGSNIQTTGEVRMTDAKGRHTTTRREMFVLPHGGILIDTPGIRELETLSTEDTVRTLFADIENLAEQCRFKDCDHVKSKNCAVLEALNSGEISQQRYNNFLKLIKEAEFSESKDDLYKRMEKKNKAKKQHKALRETYQIRKIGQLNRRK